MTRSFGKFKRILEKRHFTIIITVFFLLLLSACENTASRAAEDGKAANGRISVVTSFYPIYYLAGEIGGEHANVINLIPAGVEPHDWSPKSRELNEASKASLFLYNGAGLEGWVDGFLKGLGKDKSVKAVQVSTGISLIEADGSEHEHVDDQAEAGEHLDHDAPTVDPHTWVSPKSALVMADNIKNALIEAAPSYTTDYEANYERLKKKLVELDNKFQTELGKTSLKDIVVSHQAFGYLVRDYSLNQVAIMGLSPDAEPRAQDLLRISKFVKDNGVRYIFFEELVTSTLADTLAREANVETLVLNPIEGLTPKQEQAGENFITLMEANLQNLVKALQ
ncbi:metal ABC transporter solute-binding protein, Zn/Mn family [Paenibacillus sp. GCM10012307]|uniref:Zinc ABC transporter substrate-binding protein n=1 Tax=Paenibacillus roseus TaxID=2798579 RepID=A0A934J9E1_9BACL|nr:zinc ABC transporter substrate-binding protein [Paenibacillus roseus]MBJ6364264.1 zinc ABC transporter substrate-binding protein [Paenibacillus roseus]